MRDEEVIWLNFPISHFLKSLAHSAMCTTLCSALRGAMCGALTSEEILPSLYSQTVRRRVL